MLQDFALLPTTMGLNKYQIIPVLGQEEKYHPGEAENRDSYTLSVEHPDQNDDEDDDDYSLLSLLPQLRAIKKKIVIYSEEHDGKRWLRLGIISLLTLLYIIYFFSVLTVYSAIQDEDYWCSGDGLLVIITVLAIIGIVYFKVVKPIFGKRIIEMIKPGVKAFSEIWNKKVKGYSIAPMAVGMTLLLALIIFFLVDTAGERHRLISLIGLFLLLLFGFIFSKAPRKIVWRHVYWGLGLQFVFGLMILRWSVGRAVFNCAGNKVSAFLAFTDAGSNFLFGNLLTKDNPIFAFTVLPVILFFSFMVQVLYYYGVMQWVVIKLGWCLQVTVGTTACESVNAAANIFLGQTEAPLLIKPYLSLMTNSELHAVMTGGFSTIAGSVLAAYISFGVDPSHLLSASVMSAPAALAFAKLMYPETKVSRTGVKDIKVEKSEEANWLHAAMVGVSNAIPLVANIAASLIAFLAFIAFFNAIFDWSCMLVGAEHGTCSLQNFFGYIFMPLAWSMGVVWSECKEVGQLIGIKTMVNEFVAYSELASMSRDGKLSARSEVIATYALCGFSNIASIGINLGGFSAMAPDRRKDLAKVVVRAMISGSCACFLTACVAGVLLNDTK